MADKKLRFEVEADTAEAAAGLAELIEDVETLEKQFPEVTVEADTSEAERAVEDLGTELKELADPPKVTVTVDQSALADAKADIDRATDPGDSGKRFGATFARDFGGVINSEAASVGGDFTEGIATAFEAFGVSESLAGPLVAALGIGTVVAGAAAALWKTLNAGAESYKKSLESALEVQGDLAGGDLAAAASKVAETLKPINRELALLGISTEDATAFVLGYTDALGTLNEEADENATHTAAIQKLMAEQNLTWEEAVKIYTDARDKVREFARANDEAASELENKQRAEFAALRATIAHTGATEAANKALMAQAENALPAVQAEILTYIAKVNDIPATKVTEILADSDPNNLAQIQHELDVLTAARTVRINFQGIWDAQISAFIAAGGNLRSAILGNAGPTTVQQNITVNAGFGTDAFAVRSAVVASARQVARLGQGAIRFGP